MRRFIITKVKQHLDDKLEDVSQGHPRAEIGTTSVPWAIEAAHAATTGPLSLHTERNWYRNCKQRGVNLDECLIASNPRTQNPYGTRGTIPERP